MATVDYAVPADYTIVSGNTVAKLIAMVRSLTALGWEPKGGPVYTGSMWYQALYKEGLQ